jgi:hypothetical protein
MLLSYRNDSFTVPHTSTCVIHTQGTINDGDMIEVTSPVFASTSFLSRAINMSDRFNVVARVASGSVINDKPDGSYKAILVCDDNDVFNMYVRIL